MDRNLIAGSPSTGENVDTDTEAGKKNGLIPPTGKLANGPEPEAERDALLAQNAMLRAANENLVIATLDAQTLRDAAEAANQRQTEFLAMLAHELRNPLAPISMATSLLARMPEQPVQVTNIQQIIERQVSHLSRLLDDLLDAARINSGKISLTRRPVVLAELILSAAETVQQRMSERHQFLELVPPSTDIVLTGDAVRLAQVFSNLFINASKFTQDGGTITVTARVSGDQVVVKVADNGTGIAPELMPHIFALFTQGPRSLARSEGGLGIGLNLVRNIVELHGGSVEALSAGVGHGSIFTLTLPVATSAQTPLSPPPALTSGSHDLRVLVVEDNIDANNTLSTFLRLEGFTVTNAYDGTTGLLMASGEHFDVLICDIGLPALDGYDLIQKLRSTQGNNMPLAIALSGYGQFEDRTRAIAAGFDEYLIKPVDITQLLNLMVRPLRCKTEHGGWNKPHL